MAKIKAKAALVTIQPYGRKVVMTNDTHAAARLISNKLLKGRPLDVSELGDLESAKGYVAPVHATDDPSRVLCWIMMVLPESGHGTVSHEATHLSNFILDYIGHHFDPHNDEVEAYLVGHIVDLFMEKIGICPVK